MHEEKQNDNEEKDKQKVIEHQQVIAHLNDNIHLSLTNKDTQPQQTVTSTNPKIGVTLWTKVTSPKHTQK